jgi:hypothetical protein
MEIKERKTHRKGGNEKKENKQKTESKGKVQMRRQRKAMWKQRKDEDCAEKLECVG